MLMCPLPFKQQLDVCCFHVWVLLSITHGFGRLEIVLQFASECTMMKMYDIYT